MNKAEATSIVLAKVSSGEIKTVAEANIEIVRMVGVELITYKLPDDVRKAYELGVDCGKLSHVSLSDSGPEMYCHPGKVDYALSVRESYARALVAHLAKG